MGVHPVLLRGRNRRVVRVGVMGVRLRERVEVADEAALACDPGDQRRDYETEHREPEQREHEALRPRPPGADRESRDDAPGRTDAEWRVVAPRDRVAPTDARD